MDEHSQPGPSLIFPLKKHSRGKGFLSSEKLTILNVYKCLRRDNPHIVISDIVEETARLCGVSVSSVYKIMKEKKSTGELRSPPKSKPKQATIIKNMDDFMKGAIRKKVRTFLMRNESPTIDKILSVVNDDPELPNFKRTTMHKLLQSLDLMHVKRKRSSQNHVLDEQPTSEDNTLSEETNDTNITSYQPIHEKVDIKVEAEDTCQFVSQGYHGKVHIKAEAEEDPLAVGRDEGVGERKLLSDEENLLKPHTVDMKMECVDASYDMMSQVKLEENPDTMLCSAVKWESEEDL